MDPDYIQLFQRCITAAATANCVLDLHALWLNKCPWLVEINISKTCNVILNRKTNIAILLNGARMKSVMSRTLAYRIGRDNTHKDKGLYYLSYSTIANAIREFFQKYPFGQYGYHLLVDVATQKHQCGLYVHWDDDGRWIFHGFNPNNGAGGSGYTDLAHSISRSVESMDIWTSASNNHNGHCFALTIRFFHAIMAECYEPLRYERVTGRYMLRKREYIDANDVFSGRSSTIGIRKNPLTTSGYALYRLR